MNRSGFFIFPLNRNLVANATKFRMAYQHDDSRNSNVQECLMAYPLVEGVDGRTKASLFCFKLQG